MQYLYLHGFASGPQSAKAKYLRQRFAGLGLELICPDLNEPEFRTLTLSRQIAQVESLLDDGPVTLLGSSFGGLTGAWLAQRNPQVERLVLLAPAFDFSRRYRELIGAEELERWRQQGTRQFHHWQALQPQPLDYGFVTDLDRWDESELQRSLPTLILHGRQDEVIPLQSSQTYAAERPWVMLETLESDHGLGNVVSVLWRRTRCFLNAE